MKRKIISLLLCFVMALSLIPTVAFAAGINGKTKVDWKQFYGYTKKGYMSSTADSTAGKCEVFIGADKWTGSVTQAQIAQSGITIKPSAGYYVKQVVIACNDDGGYECQTAKNDGIVKFGSSTTESADYTIPASNLSLNKTINGRPVWHSGAGTPLHLMVWLGISPNPVTVTYDAGDMTQLNSETLIAYDSTLDTQPSGVTMTAGYPQSAGNTITYDYDKTQSTAQPQHTILDMVAAYKTVTKDGKTYQFTGWKVYSSVDAAGASGWNEVTGSSAVGDKLTLYTNYKLVAQWKEVEAPTTGSLTITKAFTGLPDGTIPDSVSFTVTGPNSYNQTVALSANNQWTQTLSNLTPGSYTVSEDETSAQVNGYVLTADEAKAITVAGGQTASASFTNTYDALPTATDTITIPVEKVWSDGNANHANDSVTVKLLNGGEETGKTLTLNAQNSWKGSFTNVPAGGSYTISEVAVDGYTASYTQPVITGLSVTGWGKKITPASNSTFDVTGNLIVANQGKNYYIWTLDPLTDTQKNDLMAAVNAADLQGLGKTLTARNTTFESGETSSFNNGAVQIAGGKITFAAENVWSMFYCGTVTLSSVTDAKINNSKNIGEAINNTATLTITKVDAEDSTKKLTGAVFTLTKGATTLSSVDNKDGTYTISGINADGDWTLNETTAPAGYQLPSNKTWTITVTKESSEDLTDGKFVTTNTYKISSVDGTALAAAVKTYDMSISNAINWDTDKVNPASLTITKVDGEDDTKLLPNAEFTLTNADGTFNEKQVTGENGTCTFTGLTAGVYTLEETTAPDGYKQTSKTWTIVVEKNDEPTDIVLTTDKTKFQKVYDCTVSELVENEDKGENEYAPLTNGLTVTNDKAPDGYSVTLPVQKIVEKKAGSKNPGKTTFAFAATMHDGQTETTTTYGTAAIETNGVGTYDGELTINVPADRFPGGNGDILLQVSEVKGTNSKWSYDDTVYTVLIKVQNYEVEYIVNPQIAARATTDQAQEPTALTFTNTYSYKYTPTPKPTTVTSVKTGDMGVALYAVTSLLSLSGAAVIIKKRKDEE